MIARADMLEAVRIHEEIERRKAGRKLLSYYPDTGPLRRELYPKHMEFFRLGKTKSERLMLAANRTGKCIAGDTLIDTPSGAPRMVRDIISQHWVWAWDGKKKVPVIAETPFTKPPEMIYRVFFRSGAYVDCAAQHRLLSDRGWLFLSHLFGCAPCLPGSTEGIAPAASLEDARRLMHRDQGSPGDYLPDSRLCDEQPRIGQGNDPASVPSLVDVPRRSRPWWLLGVLVDKCRHSLSRVVDHLSIRCAGLLSAAPSVAFSGLALDIVGQLYPGSLRASWQSSSVEAAPPPQASAAKRHPDSRAPAFVTPDGLRDSVVCYQPIGVQPIYDFHVPGFRNYCAAGVIHHNTESIGGYEVTCHLTGQYPKWWPGIRLERPWEWWASGDTRETTRDIQQAVLLGKPGDPSALGTGLIPRETIKSTTPGFIPNAISSVTVKHVGGWTNTLHFKSYDQGRKAFQGTKRCIWLDEEPPLDVYTECLLRTAAAGDDAGGLTLATFTPLQGMSEVVQSFMDAEDVGGNDGPKVIVMAGWDDVPHMSETEKKRLLASIPPHQRDARSKGIPQLGSGAIYPVEESSFVMDPVPIQPHWRIAYGMDVGWNCTAAIWGAHDKDTDTLYLFREYAAGELHPSVHAAGIKGKEGSFRYPGVIDPAARGRQQRDGNQLMQDYCDQGLDLTAANNVVEAGLFEVLTRMTTGRLKVFNTLVGWLKEFRTYQRDEKGRIIKRNDHRMDCTRYLVNSGLAVAKAPSPLKAKPDPLSPAYGISSGSWMG